MDLFNSSVQPALSFAPNVFFSVCLCLSVRLSLSYPRPPSFSFSRPSSFPVSVLCSRIARRALQERPGTPSLSAGTFQAVRPSIRLSDQASCSVRSDRARRPTGRQAQPPSREIRARQSSLRGAQDLPRANRVLAQGYGIH